MSGIIHFVNQTPVMSLCKKQNTVKTAPYGYELMVARQAAQQIIDLRYTMRMMGTPLNGPSWMFGNSDYLLYLPTLLLTNATMDFHTLESANVLPLRFHTFSIVLGN
jgi:hypothetical protein